MGSMSKEERSALVNELIGAGCCWNEEDREVLESLSDDRLGQWKAELVKAEEREVVLNAAKKGFTDSSGSVYFDEDSREWKIKPAGQQTQNEGKDSMAGKPQTTEEWLAAQHAPAEIQSAVRNAIDIEAREKDQLVTRLVKNVKGSEQRLAGLRQYLAGQTLESLRQLAYLVPEPEPVTANYAGAPQVTDRQRDEGSFAPFGLPADYIEIEPSASSGG